MPSNIAEGQARYSAREFRKYLRDARGSLAEIETQVMIGERRQYIDEATMGNLCAAVNEVGRIINGLINSLPIEETGVTGH